MTRWNDYKQTQSSAPRTKAAPIYESVDKLFADRNIVLPKVGPTVKQSAPPSLIGPLTRADLTNTPRTEMAARYMQPSKPATTPSYMLSGVRNYSGIEKKLVVPQAEKERKEATKARMKELEELQARLVRSQGMKSPANYDPAVLAEIKEVADERMALQAQNRPGAQGYVEGLALNMTRDATDSISGPQAKAAREEARTTGQYKAGNVLGNLTTQGAIYATAGAAVKALGIGSKAASGGALKVFAGRQGVDLLLDTLIQRPQEVFRGIQADQTKTEIAKTLAIGTVIDVGINLAIGGVMNAKQFNAFIKGLPEKQVVESVERVAKQNNIEPATIKEAIQTELPLDQAVKQVPSPASVIPPVGDSAALAAKQTPSAGNVTMAENIYMPKESITIDLPPPKRASYPIDGPDPTYDKIMLSIPKQPAKTTVEKGKQKLSRLYQATFSKHAPIEAMSNEARVMSSNLNRVTGTVEHMLGKSQVDVNLKPIGPSAQAIFDKAPEAIRKDWFHYLLHKHNIDRFPQGKGVFGPDIDDAFSAAKVADFEAAHPELISAGKEFTQYHDNLLDFAVDSGLKSTDAANAMRAAYPDYVPTHRYRDFIRQGNGGGGGFGQLFAKAKGSEKEILPLDLQTIALTDKIVRAGRKNQMLNEIVTQYSANNPAAQKHILGLRPLGAEPLGDYLTIGEGVAEAIKDGDGYAVKLFMDGEPYQMIVDRQLHDALKNFDSDNFVKGMANAVNKYATRPFKSLITEYNPLFTIANAARDIPTALAFSKDPAGLVKNTPEAIKEILTGGKVFQMYQAMGGTRAGFLGTLKKDGITSAIDKGSGSMVGNVLTAAPRAISKVNNFVETLPRFAEFLTTYKNTGDPFLAGYRAAELTTDFSRHGEAGKFVDAFVPYLNPALQGMNRFARAIVREPLATITKGALVITAPTAILDAINRNNEAYLNLTDRERNMYYNVPIPNSDKFIRLPKSRELGVAFSSIYEWIARSARGEEVKPEEIANTIEENYKIQGLENAIWVPAQKAWRQIANPDAYETNYFGGLIVSESMRRYSPGLQSDDRTTAIAKAVGEQFDISPIVIDYLMGSYLGVLQSVNKATTSKTGQGIESLFTNRFINDPVFRNKNMDEFYGVLDDITKKANDYNLINDIPSEEVTKYEELASKMRKRSTKLSKMWDELRDIQGSDKLNKEQKLEETRKLRQKMNKIAEDTLAKVERDLERIERK